MDMLRMDDPVGFIKGVTPTVRRAWLGLGIKTIADLLQTIPRRYDDYSRIRLIRESQAGEVVTVRGKVVSAGKIPSFRRRMEMIRVVIEDGSGRLGMTFFHQPWLVDKLTVGSEIFVSGKIQNHIRYGKTMANPLWELTGERVATGQIAPVYGLSGSLVQKTYRRLMQTALLEIEWPKDPWSQVERTRLGLLSLTEAYRCVHTPMSIEEAEQGRQRLAFDEIFAYQLALRAARAKADDAGAPIIPFDERFARHFVASLPFPLTDDQRRVSWTILQDLGKDRPMRRLLQGDVGAGKTVVAAFMAACVARAHGSAALLAPTDILARQHAATFRRLFAPHAIPCLLVTRTEKLWFLGADEQSLTTAELAQKIAIGHVVIIGTHAILEAGRLPQDMACAIIDEQHRFGVGQRETLLESARVDGCVPHLLSMTATPIPRSLALSLYGDLDVSLLRQKPAGRAPIRTFICVGEERERAYQAVREAVERGEQAFVVCPLIDASDTLGVRSATEEVKRLARGPFEGLSIEMLHGRMKPTEKEDIMRQFAERKVQILVATTVIEVGIDIPNATVMLIEGAERFGLAQLHQLRGRVGRSNLASACYVLTDVQGAGLERLQDFARIDDGFTLAEEDLKRRGGGQLTGFQQSGHEAFKAARMTDIVLMTRARDEAIALLQKDPDLTTARYWKEMIKLTHQTQHLE